MLDNEITPPPTMLYKCMQLTTMTITKILIKIILFVDMYVGLRSHFIFPKVFFETEDRLGNFEIEQQQMFRC